MGTATSDADPLDQRLTALMRAAQSGDRRAYACLLHECEPMIRRAARRAGLGGDRADDAVQDTLLTLHKARQTFDPSRSFVAWLGVIAQRRAVDILRRSGRTAQRELHVPAAYEQHVDPAADPSRRWDESRRAATLYAAIGDLSVGQREAIEHLGLREETLAEASRATGRTTGALKVNLHRALKALRLKMGRDDV